MSALFTALVEGETKESLAAMVCDLRDSRAELLVALKDAAKLIVQVPAHDPNHYRLEAVRAAIDRAEAADIKASVS